MGGVSSSHRLKMIRLVGCLVSLGLEQRAGMGGKSWSAAHKPPTAAVQTNTAGVSGGCRMRKAFITTPTPTKVPGFWSITCYNIGGLVYSLDDIEHGVLRANKGHPAAKKAQFSNDDPRSNVSLTSLDPRIHFALNCGAKSCPPIRIYKEDRLDSQLDTASKSFLQQEVKVTQGQTDARVETSRLLLWYGADFGMDDSGWPPFSKTTTLALHLRELLQRK